jgi:hypothetical protein
MNCDALQKHLLGLEWPAQAEGDARAHLAGCVACREWQRHLVQLERAATRLPVPPAHAARDAFVRSLLAAPPAVGAPPAKPGTNGRRRSVAMVLGSLILDPHASPRRRVGAGIVAGVAASLLLFITSWLAWYSWHGDGPKQFAGSTEKQPVTDPLVAELMRRNLKLAKGGTPRERVEAMAGVAGELHARSNALARTAGAEDMELLAQLYGRVVREGIVGRAAVLPDAERRAVLEPIALQLGRAESEAERLAAEEGVPQAAREALRRIALAAREGDRELCRLYGKERL